jgi:hypothetical protein
MSRIRFTLISASMMIALGLLTLNSIAQPPGGGGGGRGGFQKGGGPGGPGGFGGPGGPILRLVMNPAVQDDLKLKDKQKAAIKSLSEKVKNASDGLNKQRQEFFKAAGINFGGGPGGGGFAGGGGGQNGGNGIAQGGQNGGGRGRRGQNGDPNAAPGGAPNQKGGRGNRPQLTEEQQEQMQMLRASEQEITQGTESALSKILDKTQVARVKQIQLQLDGPQALLREDMVEKLNMTDEQLDQIRELRNEQRQASRAVQKSRGEFFAKLMPPPENNGQNAGNAQNGNQRRGGGGGGRGNFNPEAMKKAMEDPDTQKQMEQFRDESSKIDEQFSATVYSKVLYPRQRTTYKKMLGAPFDRSKMGGGGPGGWFMPGGRNAAGNAAAKKDASPGNAKSSAKANPDDDDAAESATTAPAKAPTATAKPKRSSLKDRRGSSGDTPDDQ